MLRHFFGITAQQVTEVFFASSLISCIRFDADIHLHRINVIINQKPYNKEKGKTKGLQPDM